MSFLISPVLATPLLKVPLLVSAAAFGHVGMTPPRPTPQAEEQKKYNRADLMSNNSHLLIPSAALVRWTLGGLALAEAAVILAQRFPSAPSNRVLALLWRPQLGALGVTPTTLAGALLTLGGGLLRVYCYRTLGRYFTWQLSVMRDHTLVTAGPYALVRHPSYTAWCALTVGEALMAFSPGSYFARLGLWDTLAGKVGGGFLIAWLSFVAMELLGRVPKEDATMQKEFGAQWDAWAEKTYRLIPFVY